MAQRVLHSNGYTVRDRDVVLHVEPGNLTPDEIAAQLELLGRVASDLVPLLSAMEGGVDTAELVEVATELPALHQVSPQVREAVIELATQLRAGAADGQLTKMEIAQALLAAGRHALGF